jgi:hypothetical protein
MAGIIMTTQSQDLKNDKSKPINQNTYLEKDKIRMDMKGDKTDMSTIFFGDKQVFWMINNTKKTYTEMTKEDLDKMQKTAEDAMTKMQEALKNMPPALQEKMKGMMQPQATKQSDIVYKKVASDEKVNQWVCDKYEGFSDGQKVAEVWTTGWKKLGLAEEDLTGFTKIGEFFKSMVKNMSWMYNVGTDEKAENMYFGFPIKTVNFEKDKPASKYEITEIKQQELVPTTFEVPKGYKQEKINAGN